MPEANNKIGILFTGYCPDRDLIKGILDKLFSEYSHVVELAEEGKEKLQIDISGMSSTTTDIDNEVEFIIQTAIKVKKYERVRNRTIKKAAYEAKKKLGIINPKTIN